MYAFRKDSDSVLRKMSKRRPAEHLDRQTPHEYAMEPVIAAPTPWPVDGFHAGLYASHPGRAFPILGGVMLVRVLHRLLQRFHWETSDEPRNDER